MRKRIDFETHTHHFRLRPIYLPIETGKPFPVQKIGIAFDEGMVTSSAKAVRGLEK